MRLIYTILLLTVLFSACEKPESPITLPPSVGKQMQLDMGTDYNKQVYVSFDKGVISSLDISVWDLAFDCGPNDKNIYLNGGNHVLVATVGTSVFKRDVPINKLHWRWDAANGMHDSLALHNWCNQQQISYDSVYMIDRGSQHNSAERYYQFKIKRVNNHEYELEVANKNGEQSKTFIITKDPAKNQVYFSFGNGGSYLNFEPVSEDWDLCFLSYRWIYYEFNPPLLYSVAGTFINHKFLEASADSTSKLDYTSIQIPHFATQQYSRNRDAIGFDWKVPVFGGATVQYRCRNYVNYFVRKYPVGGEVELYKIRFIDFYSQQGIKGYPTFELHRLK
ncbi:MAG: HmuY family protein [Bacteroidota bacterium]